MKKLVLAAMIGLGVMVSGCGNDVQVNNVPQQQQTQQVNNGISLAKALDLAKKGEFKPQNVKFEGTINTKVFGDEPEIIVEHWIEMGGLHKPVKIHITDPVVIQRVAKLQEERKNNFVQGDGTMYVNEITFEQWKVEVR